MSTTEAFDRGSRRYDLLVSLNPGYHQHLRSAAAELARRIAGRRGDRVGWRLLDLACGSGASTRALVEAAPAGSRIEGLDASNGMLERARAKRWPDGVSFTQAVSGELAVERFAPGSHDGIFSAYLFRNVSEDRRDLAVREAYDLLAPGGWLVVQEYSVRGRWRAEVSWTAVCWLVIIPLAMLLDRNRSLYAYLWRSVLDFDTTAQFMDRLTRAGFTDVATRTVPGWQRGILHTFVARRPEESA
ncbi:ubiquinone biosynthesis methyltransferase UbiE [Enemella dayhoffiae]|uniref:Ubiquinone biosynthesis methyltransferase UbiE n=1 Tax=Enemella dayhoffiae TaxID=2016507 RepID=A0A255GRW3_9ACTN|nr:class I SAM-dependent methyltransferase [Enemella dayhoffiae]OYO18311.1 ubiquinone biosynthesis methyltransferase UbiE [Enemella dayhoffiae]